MQVKEVAKKKQRAIPGSRGWIYDISIDQSRKRVQSRVVSIVKKFMGLHHQTLDLVFSEVFLSVFVLKSQFSPFIFITSYYAPSLCCLSLASPSNFFFSNLIILEAFYTIFMALNLLLFAS